MGGNWVVESSLMGSCVKSAPLRNRTVQNLLKRKRRKRRKVEGLWVLSSVSVHCFCGLTLTGYLSLSLFVLCRVKLPADKVHVTSGHVA